MRNLSLTIDRFIITLAVLVVVVSVLGVATLRGDDSVDSLRARAAVAIAIHNARPEPVVPPPPSELGKPKDERFVVKMYTATWCAPCQTAKIAVKAAVKEGKLPFDIEFVDVSNGGQPDWCSSIPAFGWQVEKQTRYVLGFPGMPQLIRQWEQSRKPQNARAPPANHWPAMHGYKPSWTWPGDLRSHLRSSHGVNEAGQLTQDQAEALHDQLHSGRSLNQIRARFK